MKGKQVPEKLNIHVITYKSPKAWLYTETTFNVEHCRPKLYTFTNDKFPNEKVPLLLKQ